MQETHNHFHKHSGKNILIALILNLVFTIVEIIGGIITNSTAILSDAVHDFGDTLALGCSLVLEKISEKKPTKKYTFGFKRIIVLGALVNVIILAIGSVFIFLEAIKRIMNPEEILTEVVFIIAILGIVANGISYVRMSGSKRILDQTVKIHLFEDFLGWIALLVTSIIIHITGWTIMDPIVSIIIVIILLRNIYRSIKAIIEIIMNSTISIELSDKIKDIILSTQDVEKIIDFHMWSEDGEYITLIVSLKVKGNKYQQILNNIKKELEIENIEHSFIELKNYKDKKM